MPDSQDQPPARRGHTPEEFNDSYSGTPPWDIGRPQPPFQALADAGELHGKVLDAGCGTGEHTMMAALLGLDATGIDAAPAAIARAEGKARERGVAVRFLVHNALRLAGLGTKFDSVLDCGLFHVFNDADRGAYVESLKAAVRQGGRYFMLCFSDRQPGDYGPRRVSQAEIRASFAGGWRVDSIEAATISTLLEYPDVQGWLARVTRTE
ncbi:MAG TPA: class I SAM-dependent methyltransferase [Bryobacteraceae bacterium]|jgi:cyclopropane fatty-acyl-phospholipid synthase-like methyltransferase|nr:class I SAM-dependent methyltransferase [Bryobacteraceae bacterium]